MVVLTLACPVATSSDPLLPRPGPLPTHPETAEGVVEGELEEEEGDPEHRQIDRQVRPICNAILISRPGGAQVAINYLGPDS